MTNHIDNKVLKYVKKRRKKFKHKKALVSLAIVLSIIFNMFTSFVISAFASAVSDAELLRKNGSLMGVIFGSLMGIDLLDGESIAERMDESDSALSKVTSTILSAGTAVDTVVLNGVQNFFDDKFLGGSVQLMKDDWNDIFEAHNEKEASSNPFYGSSFETVSLYNDSSSSADVFLLPSGLTTKFELSYFSNSDIISYLYPENDPPTDAGTVSDGGTYYTSPYFLFYAPYNDSYAFYLGSFDKTGTNESFEYNGTTYTYSYDYTVFSTTSTQISIENNIYNFTSFDAERNDLFNTLFLYYSGVIGSSGKQELVSDDLTEVTVSDSVTFTYYVSSQGFPCTVSSSNLYIFTGYDYYYYKVDGSQVLISSDFVNTTYQSVTFDVLWGNNSSSSVIAIDFFPSGSTSYNSSCLYNNTTYTFSYKTTIFNNYYGGVTYFSYNNKSYYPSLYFDSQPSYIPNASIAYAYLVYSGIIGDYSSPDTSITDSSKIINYNDWYNDYGTVNNIYYGSTSGDYLSTYNDSFTDLWGVAEDLLEDYSEAGVSILSGARINLDSLIDTLNANFDLDISPTKYYDSETGEEGGTTDGYSYAVETALKKIDEDLLTFEDYIKALELEPVVYKDSDGNVVDEPTVTQITEGDVNTYYITYDSSGASAIGDLAEDLIVDELNKLKTNVSSLFPFCLVFLLLDFFDIFVADPEAPEISIDTTIFSTHGVTVSTDYTVSNSFITYENGILTISLVPYSTLSTICRASSLILFCVALVFVTKKLLFSSGD